MKTVVIYVGDWKDDRIDVYFNQLISDLNGEGVEVLENTSEVLRVIQTPKVYISFVDDMRKLDGRKFDRVFGNVPIDVLMSRLKVSDVSSSNNLMEFLVDYVVSVEFGGGVK